MDANGLNFCQLQDAAHWQIGGAALEYNTRRRALRLARIRREMQFNDNRALAQQYLEQIPQSLDLYGNRAWWDADSRQIVATGTDSGIAQIYQAEAGSIVTDIVMGHDDVLYIAIDGRILMQDRRQRWASPLVEVPAVEGFKAWRLSAASAGGVWVLDRDRRALGRVRGMPLHKLAHQPMANDDARRCDENPNPVRLQRLLLPDWMEDEQPVALGASQLGQLTLLSWHDDSDASLRFLTSAGEWTAPLQLAGARSPYSVGWIGENRIAVLLAAVHDEAPVYAVSTHTVDTSNTINASGDRYPLKKDFNPGPWLHGLERQLFYPAIEGIHALHRLSFPFYSRQGQAHNNPAGSVLDSGQDGQTWHRLFIEAVIPPGCGIRIWLAASQQPDDVITAEHWYEHRFGQIYQTSAREDIPVAVWEHFESELAHQPGQLACAIEPDRSGLFSVLIQRSTRRVRQLSGRYLHVQVELTGQGQSTPELYALRAWRSRFSYVDQYLPQLYRETLYAPDADARGAATAADFFNRFNANFEGVLSQIEDRIAQSRLLTEPMSIPPQHLEWLASWIGFDLNNALPHPVQRRLLQQSGELYRRHGTLDGLRLLLEIITEGAVSGGEIVVLEDFRLRRTFASILGADLAEQDDPLTAGIAVNGNSFVGETLYIGNEYKAEFLALYSADLALDTSQQNALDQLFEKLAHRVSVLVHESVEPQQMGLIRQSVEAECPAHVRCRVLTASHPFIAGLSALLGVDSYLAPAPEPRAAQVDASYFGRNSYLYGPGALDTRLQAQGSGTPQDLTGRPQARAPDVTAGFGDNIMLDGSASTAQGNRALVAFNWEIKNTGEN